MEGNIEQSAIQNTNQAPSPVDIPIVTPDNILELLTSKNFRHRMVAYQHINDYPQHITLLQNETMAAALDTALDALLSYTSQLSNEKIACLYLQFSQSKPTIKTKLSALIEKVFPYDKLGVVNGLIQCFSHKNVKVVSSAVSRTNELICSDIDTFRSGEYSKHLSEHLCTKLQALLSHTDKDVKEETSKLVLTLYRIFYDGLLKFLVDVKPIIMKDLQIAFSQVEIPKRDIKLSDADFDSSDWKIRHAAVTSLRDAIPKMSNISDMISIISRRIRDANLSVATIAIECVKTGKIVNPDCVRGMIDRFKDKKASLNQLVSETIQETMPDVNILIDALINKNPDVKSKVLECLKFYKPTRRIGEIGKMLEDSSPVVRKAAAEVLGKVEDLSELSDGQRAKLPVVDEKTNGGPAVATRQELASESPIRSIPTGESIKIISEPEKAPKLKPTELFFEKFPLMFDKEWTKRLEFIQENRDAIKDVGCSNLVAFVIGYKETNIAIMRELMLIISTFDDLTECTTDLCHFLITKVTEMKLKDPIIAIFKKIEYPTAVQCIIQHLEQGKVGKKFISLLEVLGAVAIQQNDAIDRFLEKIKVFGMSEKRALCEFIDQYRVSIASSPAAQPHSAPVSNSTSLVEDSWIFRKDVKSGECVEEIFTEEFLEKFRKDTLMAVGMLEKAGIGKYSGLILKLYRQYDLPSPYFNSLILHLISQKYILSDADAADLVSYLLANQMEAELDLMDRIYPATRLYKILRSMPGKASVEAVFNLTKKYKDMSGVSVFDVENAVKSSEDFISFSLNIEKIVELKKNINDRFEQVAEIHQTLRNSSAAEIAAEMSYLSINGREADIDVVVSDDSNLDDLEESIIVERSNLDYQNVAQQSEDHYVLNSQREASMLKVPEIREEDVLLPDDKPPIHLSDTTAIVFPAAGLPEEKKVEKTPNIVSFTDDFNILSTKVVDGDISYEIEKSLENISISTTPHKKKRNTSEAESLLLQITDENINVSIEGLSKLIKTASSAPNSILFSANTVITTILLQLMQRYENTQYRRTALDAFLKLTQNGAFCSCLRYDTLRSIHVDLVPLVKDENTIADILINLCLNCELQILKVYFDLLEDANDVLMKLVWRHAKRVNYTSVETAAAVVKILDGFFEEKKWMFATADNIVIKVCLLHLKECVAAFSDNLKQFGVGTAMESIINLLLTNALFSMDDIRQIFRS